MPRRAAMLDAGGPFLRRHRHRDGKRRGKAVTESNSPSVATGAMVTALYAFTAHAQEAPAYSAVTEANNPLTAKATINVQNYYTADIIGLPDQTADQLLPRGLVPLGGGKVWVTESGATSNLFVEPQLAVAHQGDGQPSFQIFAGLNLQFPIGR